jgi:hypothetical protein
MTVNAPKYLKDERPQQQFHRHGDALISAEPPHTTLSLGLYDPVHLRDLLASAADGKTLLLITTATTTGSPSTGSASLVINSDTKNWC